MTRIVKEGTTERVKMEIQQGGQISQIHSSNYSLTSTCGGLGHAKILPEEKADET